MNWSKIARKSQLCPKGSWRIWFLLAGRGFGKTRAASENILELMIQKYTSKIQKIENLQNILKNLNYSNNNIIKINKFLRTQPNILKIQRELIIFQKLKRANHKIKKKINQFKEKKNYKLHKKISTLQKKSNFYYKLKNFILKKNTKKIEKILNLLLKKKINMAIVTTSYKNINNVALEGDSGILQALRRRGIAYLKKKYYIETPYGKIFTYSQRSAVMLRGMEFDFLWIDELMNMHKPLALFQQCNLCLRKKNSKMIISSTPQKSNIIRKILKIPDLVLTTGSSFQNKMLSKEYFRSLNFSLKNPNAQKEIKGQLEQEYFWKKEHIIYEKPPIIHQYYLGIDIAVEKGTTGIILLGSYGKKSYVLDCLSTKGNKWLDIVKEISQLYQPLQIAYESNQGGQLIKEILLQRGIKNVLKSFRVSTSKANRHQKLHLLYLSQSILHYKPLVNLENSMLSGKNLDSLDALYIAVLLRYKLYKKKL